MRCPSCNHRAVSLPGWAAVQLGPIWKDRNVTCSRCDAQLKPASRFASAGLHVGGLLLGIGAAFLFCDLVPLYGHARTIVFVALALSVDLAVSYQLTRYELASPADRPRLPQSRVVDE